MGLDIGLLIIGRVDITTVTPVLLFGPVNRFANTVAVVELGVFSISIKCGEDIV